MATLNERGELDPHMGAIITCLGPKGSGKSKLGMLFFASYPYDRIVIDIAGDDGPAGQGALGDPADEPVHDLHGHAGDLPARFPEHLRRDEWPRLTLRYVPDPGSPTYLEDMDAVVGMAYRHGRCIVLVHEIHDLVPANRTPAHTRRVLKHSRHREVTWIGCGPRAKTLDPLQLAQSDLIYTFDMPNIDDRKHLAAGMGWDLQSLSEGLDDLPQHGYLRYDRHIPKPQHPDEPDLRVVEFPPLPADVVADLDRQKPPKPKLGGGR